MITWKHINKSLLIIALLCSFGLQAQHKPFQFGFKGAVNLGWFKTDAVDYQNNGARIGGSWGFVADIFLMENYSFTTGFDVLYLNGRFSHPITLIDSLDNIMEATRERTIKTRYVQLPIAFTMKTNLIKEKFRIYGQIGYGLGFLLSAKASDEYNAEDGEHFSNDSNIYDEVTFTRSSLILGLGVEIPIHESTCIRSGFKFDNCFVNILKGPDKNARNNLIEFSAAVIF